MSNCGCTMQLGSSNIDWHCRFCPKSFDIEAEAREHEKTCIKKKPVSRVFFYVGKECMESVIPMLEDIEILSIVPLVVFHRSIVVTVWKVDYRSTGGLGWLSRYRNGCGTQSCIYSSLFRLICTMCQEFARCVLLMVFSKRPNGYTFIKTSISVCFQKGPN